MIKKANKSKNFTIVDNEFLRENGMSWRAKGLLTYLLSLPEDWQINIKDLTRRSVEGRDSTLKTLNELIHFGYAARVAKRDKNGKIARYDYFVSDDKAKVLPLTEKPLTDFQEHTNNTLEQNTNPTDKKSQSDLYKKAVEIYFDFYEDLVGTKPKFDGVAGKSMKLLLKNLKTIAGKTEDSEVLKALNYIFVSWHLLDEFYKKQLEVRQINSNLNNIIAQIKSRRKNKDENKEVMKKFLNL